MDPLEYSSFCGCKLTLNCQKIYFFMLFSVVTMKSFIFVKRNFLTKKAVLQTIYLNRLDFLDYYIENFSDQFEEQEEEIKEILSQYRSNDDKEDLYDE